MSLYRNPPSQAMQGTRNGAMLWPLHVTLIPDLVLARAALYVLDD